MKYLNQQYMSILNSNDGITIRKLGNCLHGQINDLLDLLEVDCAGAQGLITNHRGEVVFSCSKR